MPWLERLEDRTLLTTTDVFTNPLGGPWTTGSDWSLLASPTATQDAVVSPTGTGAVVTHTSGADTVHSLSSNNSLLISGGSVTVTGNLSGMVRETTGGQLNLSGTGSTLGDVTLDVSGGGVVNLSGTLNNTGNTLTITGDGNVNLTGTLTGGTLVIGDGTQLNVSSGTLDGVTVNGNLGIPQEK